MEQIYQVQRRNNLVGVPYSVPEGISGDKLAAAHSAMAKQLGFLALCAPKGVGGAFLEDSAIFGISKPYFGSLF